MSLRYFEWQFHVSLGSLFELTDKTHCHMISSESPETPAATAQPVPLIIFGEVLFDCFSSGQEVLGGAPFNVAWGLRGLGHPPSFLSAVGRDAKGRDILEKMKAWGMADAGLQLSERATGEVRVTIESDEPQYEICQDRAWDFVEDKGWSATELIYHGSLALRSRQTRQTFEAIVQRSSAKRFFDINLRPPYDDFALIKHWVQGVDWLKLNIDELGELVGEASIDFADAEPAIASLRSEYGVANVLLTGGRRGALISGAVGQAVCSPAPTPDPFVDTVGAGDAFSAYTIHGILRGLPVRQIVEEASHFAAKVCGLNGATSVDKSFYQ